MILIRLMLIVLLCLGAHVHAAADQKELNKQLYNALVHGASLARVQDLIEVHRADINGIAEHSIFRTPALHLAVSSSTQDSSVLVYLIGRGVDVNGKESDNSTACHYAAAFNRADFLKILFNSGANVKAKKKDGKTPLHSACYNNALHAAKALFECGADIQAEDEMGQTPLDIAREYNYHDIVKLIEEYESIPDIKQPEVG